MAVPRECDKAEVVTVIKTKVLKGAGTVEDPLRFLYQFIFQHLIYFIVLLKSSQTKDAS